MTGLNLATQTYDAIRRADRSIHVAESMIELLPQRVDTAVVGASLDAAGVATPWNGAVEQLIDARESLALARTSLAEWGTDVQPYLLDSLDTTRRSAERTSAMLLEGAARGTIEIGTIPNLARTGIVADEILEAMPGTPTDERAMLVFDDLARTVRDDQWKQLTPAERTISVAGDLRASGETADAATIARVVAFENKSHGLEPWSEAERANWAAIGRADLHLEP